MPSQHDIAIRALTRSILEQLSDSGGETALAALTRAILKPIGDSDVEVALAALACAAAEVITASGDTNEALDIFRKHFAAALDDEG